MGCRKLCCRCAAVPLSVLVVLVAVLVPQILPKEYCVVGSDGACTRVEAGKADACEAGILLRVTRQGELGLRHVEFQQDVPFARLQVGECNIAYVLTCAGSSPSVVSTSTCSGGAAARVPLGRSWEVCAKGGRLTLLAPVTSLAFDTELAAGSSVAGCIGVTAPSAFLALGAVRGAAALQREALISAKKKAGGCPIWRSEEDMFARSEDFLAERNPVFAFAVKLFLKKAKADLAEFRNGLGTEDAPEGTVIQIAYLMGLAGSGGGPSALFQLASVVNCGEMVSGLLPAPALQVTRHAEVGKLIADPMQRRKRIIGGGAAECCFDETLPVFVSTGTPEHSQVRRLWDAVGLATMHEGELPEVKTLPPSLKRSALDFIGAKALILDECVEVVTPLFLEKLWQKKPTEQEAKEIAEYGTVGGPCIFGQIIGRLPYVPGRIRAVREKAVAFATDSPVGKALAKEIEKPEYAELRAQYAARPKGVVGTAIQNLADASLFAGLIGTSTAASNCLKQVHEGPQFVRMFRQNSTAFMLEVMRTVTAVGGSIQVLREPLDTVVMGEDVRLRAGSLLLQGTGLAAGYDAAVFPDPGTFDSARDNLGETMNWNGKSKHVLARDYKNAPRFCPGMALSIKIASKVCHHYSRHLPEA